MTVNIYLGVLKVETKEQIEELKKIFKGDYNKKILEQFEIKELKGGKK